MIKFGNGQPKLSDLNTALAAAGISLFLSGTDMTEAKDGISPWETRIAGASTIIPDTFEKVVDLSRMQNELVLDTNEFITDIRALREMCQRFSIYIAEVKYLCFGHDLKDYVPAGIPTLTSALFEEIRKINFLVNHSITPSADGKLSSDDVWNHNIVKEYLKRFETGHAPTGDCDEYSMLKYHLLLMFIVKNRFPLDMISFAFVMESKTNPKEPRGHVVVLVKVRVGGKMVHLSLDNLVGEVLPVSSASHLRFISTTTPNANTWVRVKGIK